MSQRTHDVSVINTNH